MMLANIVDDVIQPKDKHKTTLIVASPALITQWMSEISRHVETGVIGDIVKYHGTSRLVSNNPERVLRKFHIILTTYEEVRKSYPNCDPPLHLVSEQAKSEWWRKHYDKNVGTLHKIKFRRIVLDEAQVIKNHSSKTSIAVRSLMGHYRWAISGVSLIILIKWQILTLERHHYTTLSRNSTHSLAF